MRIMPGDAGSALVTSLKQYVCAHAGVGFDVGNWLLDLPASIIHAAVLCPSS